MARRIMYEVTFEVPDEITDDDIDRWLSYASVQIRDPEPEARVYGVENVQEMWCDVDESLQPVGDVHEVS